MSRRHTSTLLRVGRGAKWTLSDPIFEWAVREASRLIDDPASIPAAAIMKAGVRRLVFGLPARGDSPAVVVKAFPLDGLRPRLRQDKYAPSEARNLETAHALGLPVPAVHATGARTQLGLVRWNAVLMERIDGATLDRALREAACSTGREALLMRCLPIFVALYRAGCNHIDLRPSAIMLGATPGDDRLLDFQYCTFRATPDIGTLAAQTGQFLNALAHEVPGMTPDDLGERFVEALLDALSIEPAARRALRSITASNRRERPSIAERLRQ